MYSNISLNFSNGYSSNNTYYTSDIAVLYGWPSWLYWSVGIYYVTTEALAIVFQVMTLLTILRSYKLRSKPRYYLIINLTLGEIVWLVCVSPYVVVNFFGEDTYMGEIFCSILGFISYWMSFQTSMALMFIALDRLVNY